MTACENQEECSNSSIDMHYCSPPAFPSTILQFWTMCLSTDTTVWEVWAH